MQVFLYLDRTLATVCIFAHVKIHQRLWQSQTIILCTCDVFIVTRLLGITMSWNYVMRVPNNFQFLWLLISLATKCSYSSGNYQLLKHARLPQYVKNTFIFWLLYHWNKRKTNAVNMYLDLETSTENQDAFCTVSFYEWVISANVFSIMPITWYKYTWEVQYYPSDCVSERRLDKVKGFEDPWSTATQALIWVVNNFIVYNSTCTLKRSHLLHSI